MSMSMASVEALGQDVGIEGKRDGNRKKRDIGIEIEERAGETYGLTTTNANRNAVLSQLIAPSETPKYAAASVETAEKVSHYTEHRRRRSQ